MVIIDNAYKIRLIKNSKRPHRAKWDYMKTQEKINGNYGILTGEQNDIIVIDIDFYDKNGITFNADNSDFLNYFGEDYIKKFNTLTQKTANGGYHLIFKYDKQLKQTVNLTHNIDIRSDGGYIVGYGSSIFKKKYTIELNSSIKKVPKTLKDWLINNLYTKKELRIIDKLNKNPTNNNDKYDEGDFKFINNEKLLRDIFDKLPIDYYKNHGIQKTGMKTWMDFTGFCKAFNCMELWDEYSKKKCPNKYDKNNNKIIWDRCNPKYNSFSKIFREPSLKAIKHYKFYLRYKALQQYKLDYFKEIQLNKLGYNFFNRYKNDNLIIQSDTGTGKTTSFKHYVKNHNIKFISIVSRITLADEQYTDFNEMGIDCAHYSNGNISNKGNLIITIDSLLKVLKYKFDIKEYVFFLDEFNSIIEHLLLSDTLKSNRVFIFEFLLKILKECKQFICVDADISNISVNYAEYAGREFKIIKNLYKHNSNVNAEEIDNLQDFMNKIYEEKKYMVCCDTRTNAIYLYEMLNGKDDKKMLLLTGETDEYYKLDDYERVIFSPKIIYGIDSRMERTVFCYYKTHIINPSQMLQQICRTRNIKNLYYFFENKYFNFCSYKDLEDCQFTNENIYNLQQEYHGNYGINSITTQQYFDLYCLLDYKIDCYNSNAFLHFLLLLYKRGFNVKEKYINISSIAINSKKELVTTYLDANFDITNMKSKKILNLLHLPKSKIEIYKDLFLNNKELIGHFAICKYFFKTRTQMKNDLLIDNDMVINKIKSHENKIIFLKRFQKDVNFKTEPHFNAKPLSKDKSTKYMKEYNTLFNRRNTISSFDLREINDIIKLNIIMLKHVFNIQSRSKIIDSKICEHKDDPNIYSFNKNLINKVNTYHKDLYELRKRHKYRF